METLLYFSCLILTLTMKQNYTYIILGSVVLFILLHFLSIQYTKQTKSLHSDILPALDSALNKDLDRRVKLAELPVLFVTTNMVPDSLKGKGFKEGKNGEKIEPYNDKRQKESAETFRLKALQYALIDKCPISAFHLDSLFQEELKNYHISGKTNVRIVINNDETFSAKSKRPDKSYYATSLQYVDVKNKVGVQAFVKYDHWSVIRRMYESILMTVGILGCGIGVLVWNIRKRKFFLLKNEKEPVLQPVHEVLASEQNMTEPIEEMPPKAEEAEVEEEVKTKEIGQEQESAIKKLDNGEYTWNDIYFNADLCIVKNNSTRQEVSLTPQMKQLLLLFLEAPHNYFTTDTLCQKLWPDSKESDKKLQSRLAKLISTLKKALCDIAKVDIVKEGSCYKFKYKPSSKTIRWNEEGESYIGEFRFHASEKCLWLRDYHYPLSATQAEILTLLVRTPEHFVTKEDLEKAINKHQQASQNTKDLSSIIEGLNKHLNKEDMYISDKDGTGYLLN